MESLSFSSDLRAYRNGGTVQIMVSESWKIDFDVYIFFGILP